MKIRYRFQTKILLVALITVIPLCLSLATNTQAAKYFKWVDKDGVTHYTETPPSNTQSTAVRTFGQDPEGAEQAKAKLAAQRNALTEAITNKKADDGKNALDVENEKIKNANCETAKNNLKILQQHSRIREKGDDGEYSMITEDKRQERIKNANERIKEFCN